MTEETKDISPHKLTNISIDEVKSRVSAQMALKIGTFYRELPSDQRENFDIFIRYFYLQVYSDGFHNGTKEGLEYIDNSLLMRGIDKKAIKA